MGNIKPEHLTAIIDNREQMPWTFQKIKTVRGTLTTGDVSLVGLENWVVIERKSEDDYLQSLTAERDRFTRELNRMLAYPSRAVVVESSWARIQGGLYRSKATPSSIFGSSAGIIAMGIPLIFAGDRENAATIAERILLVAARRYWRALMPFLEALGEKGSRNSTGIPGVNCSKNTQSPEKTRINSKEGDDVA